MTTEQAADKLGALAVSFPKMKLAMQAQMYAQLRADEQEAVRVLFGYGESEEQPEAPAPTTPADDLIAALKTFAQTIQREKPAAAVELPAEVLQTTATGKDSRLAAYLRMLAEQIEQRQVSPAPEVFTLKPERQQAQNFNTNRRFLAKAREENERRKFQGLPPLDVNRTKPEWERVDYSEQLVAARAAKVEPTTPAPAPKPAPRPKIVLPPPPVRAITAPSPYPYGMTKAEYDRVQRIGVIAMIQAIAFIVAVILFPVLLVWACWE